MRTLFTLAFLLAALGAPVRAQAPQGTLGVSLQVVPPSGVYVGAGARAEAGRLSAPLTLAFAARPHVQVEGWGGCAVAVVGGGEPGGWRARLHCAAREWRGVRVVRLLVTPAS